MPEGTFPLIRKRASDVPGGDPLIGFTSMQLGEELMVGRGLDGDCSVVVVDKLDHTLATEARKCSVLLFDSSTLVRQYLKDPTTFDVASHTTPFENAQSLARSAL